jgi:hypothetical protein
VENISQDKLRISVRLLNRGVRTALVHVQFSDVLLSSSY